MNSIILFIFFFNQQFVHSYKCGTELIKKKPFIISNDKINHNKRKLSTEYTPIKIKVDFTELGYQVSKPELNFWMKVFPDVIKYFQSLFLVRHDNIQVDEDTIKNQCEVDYIGDGFENWFKEYDLVIFPYIDNDFDKEVLAAATPCLVLGSEDNYKPVGGIVGLNRLDYYKLDLSKSEDFFIKLLLHELSHVLGFHPFYFENLNLIKIETRNDLNYSYIVSPKVLEKARIHFNCQDIKGIQLEDQGGEGSIGAHWESRYMLGDYMISTDYTEVVISDITLALFEDTGLYKVNYYTGGLFRFGKNQGCSFLEEKCIKNANTDFPNEFCLTPGEDLCGSSHISRGRCLIFDYPDSLEDEYQYFTNSHYGGAFESANFCPVSYDYLSDNEDYNYPFSCKNGILKSDSYGEIIGENSLCFESCLIPISSNLLLNKLKSICYSVKCDKFNKEIIIYINTFKVICPGHRTILTNPEGFKGQIVCPEYNLICSSEVQCNDMLDCINKNSRELRYTNDYLQSQKFEINYFLYLIIILYLI